MIKVQEYISRYENDIYHYTGQFIRLKKENWEKLLYLWESQASDDSERETEVQKTILSRWRDLLKRNEEAEDNDDEFSASFPVLKTKNELKQYFLNNLFPFQLKWASTTADKMSFLDHHFRTDSVLKYYLQRVPDTFLLMYHPIFDVNNVPLQGDCILISPINIEIITIVEKDPDYRIVAGNERTWYIEKGQFQKNILSPMVSLKRTEAVVRGILHAHELDFPIEKVVLSRTNNIKSNVTPSNTVFVDREQIEQWLMNKRQVSVPLKHAQLKISDILLRHCRTVAVNRPEWDEDIEFRVDLS